MEDFFTTLCCGNHILMGIVGTLLTGFATGVGALPILLTTKISERMLDALLGFAAGVMLAATSFSLIIPAIELGGIWPTCAGLVLGAVFLALLDHLLPHSHFIKGKEGPSSNLRRAWLLIIAITLHNFPEGLAVGVGFGAENISDALALMIAIGLQNMPEGLAVALPLVREKWSRGKALLYAFGSGVAEPIAGVFGVIAVTVMQPLLPWGLAFAAGAMLYVVSDEIIPETHSRGFEQEGTWGVIVGFLVMMFLDNALQ
ncbi:MAG: ZIP family metal transporter [Anaerolineae bacterium]|nr:ZIP family metal transporter [Anaerolineae bacterium]